MVNDITAAAIENTAKIIKSTLDIQIGNVNMPMLIKIKWLLNHSGYIFMISP